MRILHRQLRLADPAHAVQGLHHRPIPGQQLLSHRNQQSIPPCKTRIPRRNVPDPWQYPRSPRAARPADSVLPADRREIPVRAPVGQVRSPPSAVTAARSPDPPRTHRNTPAGAVQAGPDQRAPPQLAPAPGAPQPIPVHAPATRTIPPSYTAPGRSTLPKTTPLPARLAPAHRSSRSRSCGPPSSPTHPAQRCTRHLSAARPPTPPTHALAPHDLRKNRHDPLPCTQYPRPRPDHPRSGR